MANIKAWPAERVTAAGPSILACIQRLVDEFPERLTAEWLLEQVRIGRQEMWVAFDEAEPDIVVMTAFTELQHYLATGYTFLKVTNLGGGRLSDVLPLLDEIEAWGRRNGARSIEPEGREGWVRILKGRGYVRRSTTLTKQLA